MADTNIPVSERTLARLKELADWDGIAAGEALERAVNAQYDRKFWEAVDAGYAALRADPKAWGELEAERKLWDATLLDGLDRSERWAEDRTSTSAEQE
jgi:hypothetical protein